MAFAPRLALVIETADSMRMGEVGAKICALLSERDFFIPEKHSSFATPQDEECDILIRLEQFDRHKSLQKTFFQLKKNLKNPSQPQDADSIKKLLFYCFKDHLCRRRLAGEPKALMITGNGVVLDNNSSVKNSEYFVAITIIDGLVAGEARISIASGVPKSWLAEIGEIGRYDIIEYDEKAEKFIKNRAEALVVPGVGQLTIGSIHQTPASPDEVSDALANIAIKYFTKILAQNEELKRWWYRYLFFAKHFALPDLDKITPEAIAEACLGENSLAALYKKDLVYFFESKIDSKVRQAFLSACPQYFLAPTGSKIPIDYSDGNAKVEIRLQELFGQTSTPTILNGKKNLTLVLLGPHFRPIQVTQDLMSFWQNGYPEVRKELRARYPKHSWPDDPLSATPQAKGRKHK